MRLHSLIWFESCDTISHGDRQYLKAQVWSSANKAKFSRVEVTSVNPLGEDVSIQLCIQPHLHLSHQDIFKSVLCILNLKVIILILRRKVQQIQLLAVGINVSCIFYLL